MSPSTERTIDNVMECEQCGKLFDPIQTRWLCPHCKWKANCCEGAPQ